jgi:hypothetical protein
MKSSGCQGQPDALRDEGLQNDLLRLLRHWSAFRPLRSKRREAAQAALCERLPEFIADVQALPNARLHLSDMPDDSIWPLAQTLEARLSRFGREVKGQGSCVLPSKTAHLLLPGFVPAYDIGVIVNSTMANLVKDASFRQRPIHRSRASRPPRMATSTLSPKRRSHSNSWAPLIFTSRKVLTRATSTARATEMRRSRR